MKNIDKKITYFMQNKLSNPFLDTVMLFFTYLGNFCAIWILILLYYYFIGGRRYAFMMGISLLLVNALNNGLLKAIFRRERPFEQYEDITIFIKDPYGSSFPSGHSATSFAAAVVVYACTPLLGIFALFIASGVAFSRMYLRVHFFTDVLCGVLAGTLCALLTIHYYPVFFG